MKNACITTLSKKRANCQIVCTVDHNDALKDVQEKTGVKCTACRGGWLSVGGRVPRLLYWNL